NTEPKELKTLLDYSIYMTQLIGSESCDPTPSPCLSERESPTTHKKVREHFLACSWSAEGQSTWVNSLVGRIFWDFLREKYWTNQVAHKIQKKLSKIKLPYFMNELTLADLDMGTCLPQVLNTSKPTLDHRDQAMISFIS
uniref:SMP-LTD domain-containing protein n=1 Tax=Echeneis naucrates TaxID=173247 RepID=A0A665WEV5_ECHNA